MEEGWLSGTDTVDPCGGTGADEPSRVALAMEGWSAEVEAVAVAEAAATLGAAADAGGAEVEAGAGAIEAAAGPAFALMAADPVAAVKPATLVVACAFGSAEEDFAAF